jgi:hypothetical protein
MSKCINAHDAKVVDEFSATIGYDRETKAPIQSDHESMVKFSDEQNADYRNVWGKLKIMKRHALAPPDQGA